MVKFKIRISKILKNLSYEKVNLRIAVMSTSLAFAQTTTTTTTSKNNIFI
ncbi:hypothetical protein [Chryseobacterium indoltheticum]